MRACLSHSAHVVLTPFRRCRCDLDPDDEDQLILCCREIDPNLLPPVGTLLDPPGQTGGRARDPSPCRIEYGLAVICLSVSYFELDFHTGRSLHPRRGAIDTVLVEPDRPSGEVMPAFGRYRDKPQNRLPHHDRVSVCPLSVQTRSPNQCQAVRRDVRQSGQRRLLLDLTRVPNAWRRRRCNLDSAERQ